MHHKVPKYSIVYSKLTLLPSAHQGEVEVCFEQDIILWGIYICIYIYIRAREIDKCQSVRQFSKRSAISGRTYGNSRLEVYVRIYITFEFRKSLDRGYRREFLVQIPYIAASLFILNICLSFWVFYRRKEYLNKIKILRNFRE